jgi:hypothetical protein
MVIVILSMVIGYWFLVVGETRTAATGSLGKKVPGTFAHPDPRSPLPDRSSGHKDPFFP